MMTDLKRITRAPKPIHPFQFQFYRALTLSTITSPRGSDLHVTTRFSPSMLQEHFAKFAVVASKIHA